MADPQRWGFVAVSVPPAAVQQVRHPVLRHAWQGPFLLKNAGLNLNNYGQILRPYESLGTLISNGRKPLEIVNTQAGKIPARDLQEKDQWQSGFMLFRDE
jgi:hypothetical protein